MQAKQSIFTCWTKFKGGRYQLEKGSTWKEYNDKQEVITELEQLNRSIHFICFIIKYVHTFNSDDYDLEEYEVILLDRTTGTIIKLDKLHSRESKIPQNDDKKDVDLSMLELFKMKWDLKEKGQWDSLNQDKEE